MKILFFAQTRQFSRCEEIEFAVENPLSTDELWSRLENQFPGIDAMRATTRLARNSEYSPEEGMFANEDEVALIPPVSGG
ncbi:MAG: MoaD/ThiS family protein [Verrucomicrobiota bacterium]|nr:MoaD/ThiS family protein [Verrucomicrobiota bacterium]